MSSFLYATTLLLCILASSQDGHAAVVAPTTEDISGVVNSYLPVVEVTPCLRTIRVGAQPSSFSVGDRVLLVQMKGALVSEQGDSTYGDVRDLRGAGAVDYLVIDRISGDTIVFAGPWVHNYDVSGIVQLVRVAVYDEAHVVGTVVPQPWDGRTGGIVALDIERTLVMDADISASSMGFRGGRVSELKDNCDGGLWSIPFSSGEAGEKGEGIALLTAQQAPAAKGAPANGGGGGNGANAGGAGGANGGAGGNGGDANDKCPTYVGAGGRGGKSVAAAVEQQRLFMGGGGGGGHQNNSQGTSGRRGGGIVMIRATNIIAPKGRIMSAGEGVPDTSAWNRGQGLDPGDGAGGGGAGGSVMLQAERVIGPLTIDVRGGNGGHVGARYQPAGPGGGGGGGVIALTKPHPTVIALARGGTPGVHVWWQTGANVFQRPWGARPGDSGTIIQNFTWRSVSNPTLSVAGSGVICEGDSLELVASEGFASYLWSTGEQTRRIWVKTSGQYRVAATDSAGCTRPQVSADVTVRRVIVNADPDVLFGTTEVGLPLRAQWCVRNAGLDTVTVSSVTIPSDVRLVSPLPPFVIPANDSVCIVLEFEAPRVMEHVDTIRLDVNAPCSGGAVATTRATVTGERVQFLLPRVEIDYPGLEGELPIRVRMDSPTPPITGARVRFVLAFNGDLFTAERSSRGQILSRTYDSATGLMRLEIACDSVDVTSTGEVLTIVRGRALLADTGISAIAIERAQWTRQQGSPVWRSDTGRITVGMPCFESRRAVRFLAGSPVSIRSQSDGDVVVITTPADVHMPLEWSIFGLSGELYLKGSGVSAADGLHISTQFLPAGHYLVQVVSGSSRIARMVTIYR